MFRSIIAAVTLIALSYAEYSWAEDPKKPAYEHRGPPPIALEACASANEGDVCSFVGRRGETLEGTCEIAPDEILACRPVGGPPKHDMR